MANNLLPNPNTPFGHPLRGLWWLDPGIRFLNHGSFGAAPRHVLAAQARWREAMEREPVCFMVDELPGALMAARVRLAGLVGAVPQRLTFADNATAGANAVLRWRAGERIVIADCICPGVKNAARFVAERHGLEVIEARVPWPLPGPEALVEAHAAALADGARLAIVDHVFAPLAVVSPLEETVRLYRARGAAVLVDGAHAPGMLPLALDPLAGHGVVRRQLPQVAVRAEGLRLPLRHAGVAARPASDGGVEFFRRGLRAGVRLARHARSGRAALHVRGDGDAAASGGGSRQRGSGAALAQAAARRAPHRGASVPGKRPLLAALSAQVYNELSDYEALARVFG